MTGKIRTASAEEARVRIWELALQDAETSALNACFYHRLGTGSQQGWRFYNEPKLSFNEFLASLDRQIQTGLQRPLADTTKFEIIRALYEHAIVRFLTVFNGGADRHHPTFPVAKNRGEVDALRKRAEAIVSDVIKAPHELARYHAAMQSWQRLRGKMIAHSDAEFLQPETHLTVASVQTRHQTYALLLDQSFEDSSYLLYIIRLWQSAVSKVFLELRGAPKH